MLFLTRLVTPIYLLSFTNVKVIMQVRAIFNLIRRSFRVREKLNYGPTGRAKGTNQTAVGQACAVITRKFCGFE